MLELFCKRLSNTVEINTGGVRSSKELKKDMTLQGSSLMTTQYAVANEVDALPKILLVEDDTAIADLVSLHLQPSYKVQRASRGDEGYALACEESWDAILLDLRLPKKDGLEICRDLRANANDTPILMLTSRASELDSVLGLEMGADDYMTKPFSFLELEARIKALLRRAKVNQTEQTQTETLLVGDLSICQKTHSAKKRSRSLDLTAKEFDLLSLFMRSPGQVFSRSELLSDIWGYGHSGYEHTVNSHINRLRSKIESNPADPQYIVTVWGVGYKLNNA